MSKNILAAALLGLFLFGGTPAEAATSEVAIGSQVELQEVMHRPHRQPQPQRNRKFECVYPLPPKQVKQVRDRDRTPKRPPWRCGRENRFGNHVPHLPGGHRR